MNLLVTGAYEMNGSELAELEAAGYCVTVLPNERTPVERPERYEAVVCNSLFLYQPIEAFSNLRLLRLTSAGLDRVPLDYIRTRGIELHNAAGVYTSGIKDINYVDPWLAYLFTALYVLMYARRTSSQIINFSGHFKQTQWRSVLESAINLSVSIFLVTRIDIYGVLIGTIAALLYRTNDVILYTNKKILNRSPWRTYRRWITNLAVMVLLVFWLNRYLSGIKSYVAWVLNAAWVAVVCLVIFFLADSLFDYGSFCFIVRRVKGELASRWKRG